MEVNCEKLLAYRSIDTGYCTAETCTYIFCPLGYTSLLCGWKCPKERDAWVRQWKWAAKSIIAVLHSLYSPALTRLQTYYNKSPATGILRGGRGAGFLLAALSRSPPQRQSCCRLSRPGQTAALPMLGSFTDNRVIS